MAFGHALAMSHRSPTGGLLGSELLANGSFATDTVWTKGLGWTIAAGVATITTPASASNLVQPVTIITGSSYFVEFVVSGYVSGLVRARLLNSGAGVSNQITGNGNGTFSGTLFAASACNEFALIGVSSLSSLSVDVVSLRRIL